MVLATLSVAATSTDTSLTLDAAPTTEAVSCIANAAQAPNCVSLNPKYPCASGKNKTAIAFKKKTIVIAVVNSSGLDFIAGATAAIAVPPQTAVPEAKRKESFLETPNNLPKRITAPNDRTTKIETSKK